MHRRALFCIFICTIFLLSCSDQPERAENQSASESSSGPGTFEVNACSLITPDEAEKMLGEPLQQPQESQHVTGEAARAALSHCVFPTTNGKSISIFYRKSPIDENSPEAIHAAKTAARAADATIKDADGIGDAAFWAEDELHVFVGDRSHIIISLDGIPDKAMRNELAGRIAELALDRV